MSINITEKENNFSSYFISYDLLICLVFTLRYLEQWGGQEQCDHIVQFLQVFGNKLSKVESSPNNLVSLWAISNNVTIV